MENVLASNSPLSVPNISRPALWINRGLLGLAATFLMVDAAAKLLALAPVVEATRQLGYSVGVIRPLGFVLATATLLHLIPRTQMLGALLLTAYLGGATATLVRVGTSCWFPVTMGALIWITYYFRSPSLRAFIRSTSVDSTSLRSTSR